MMLSYFAEEGNGCFYMNINGLQGQSEADGDARQAELKERYLAAVDSFIDRIRPDPNVIAVIVGGSLAYDVIWEKSDIDMTIVVRDQTLANTEFCAEEDGITVNIFLCTRSDFKRMMERSIGGSFHQSYFAKGQMVYAADESLISYFEELKEAGEDDIALSALLYAAELAGLLNKCRKWLYSRKDLLYTQYFLLKAAESIAHMELCLRGIPASRESIQKVHAFIPGLLEQFYRRPMSGPAGEEELAGAISVLDGYLEEHMDVWKKPLLAFMADGELKTVTVIRRYFRASGHFLVEALEYLADKGVIEKASQTIRLTPKGRQVVEEIGYLYIPEEG